MNLLELPDTEFIDVIRVIIGLEPIPKRKKTVCLDIKGSHAARIPQHKRIAPTHKDSSR